MLANKRCLQEIMWKGWNISYFLWSGNSVLHWQKVFACNGWEIVVYEAPADFLWGPSQMYHPIKMMALADVFVLAVFLFI